jgi:hypothetical protein
MCLETKDGCIIAEENVICYKVLRQINFFENTSKNLSLNSPYRYTDYFVNQIMEDSQFSYQEEMRLNNEIKFGKLFSNNEIRFGLHTFKNFHDATAEADDWIRSESSANLFAVYKCIIPKGSRYYVGTWNNHKYENVESYSSEKLQLVECIYKT